MCENGLIEFVRKCQRLKLSTLSNKIRPSPTLIPVGTTWSEPSPFLHCHGSEQTLLFIRAARHSLPFVSPVKCFFLFFPPSLCCCPLRSCCCQQWQEADEPLNREILWACEFYERKSNPLTSLQFIITALGIVRTRWHIHLNYLDLAKKNRKKV